jgi:outer membrane protein OmpA-like peptidoglycan-associated protein
VAFLASTALAQSVKLEGLIKACEESTLILQTGTSPELAVVLTDDTKVSQVQGAFQVRKKEMGMAALIPGLAVKVEGNFNDQNQLVATSVKFKGNDLAAAQAMQAGMHEMKVQTQENTEELQKQNAELKAQNEALQGAQARLVEHQAKLAEHKAAIDENVARFGQLDDYYIFDVATVYFANGKADVEPQFNPLLLDLAKKAATVNGYIVEVKGYASSVGSAKVNQRLSEERASNVIACLIQQGRIPLTRILAPGAMGTSQQVGNGITPQGQAQNRRVVVRVLQNKAIAGIPE